MVHSTWQLNDIRARLVALDRSCGDFADCAFIGSTAGARRLHEHAFVVQVGIGVHFEDKQGLVALAESEIDAAIVSQSDHSGDIEHKPPNSLRGLFIERGGAASRHGLRERC